MEFFTQYNEVTPEKETAKSEYEFTIWWNNQINGKALIRPKATINDSLKGSAFIWKKKNSNLKFVMGVRPLNRVGIEGSVIEDTYLTDKMPTVSFGDASFIKIGMDRGYKYKSLLYFDISEIKDKYVTKLNIILKSQEKKSIKTKIYAVNSKWKENSITWNYHPKQLEGSPTIIHEFNGSDSNTFTIDLKPIATYFNENNIDPKNFGGIAIEAIDYVDGTYKTFLSDEYSSSAYRPKVEIQYLDPDSFVNENERIVGRANIYGSLTKSDILKGKAYIDREDMYSKIRCKAYIKPEKIDGFAKIAALNDKLKAKARVVYTNEELVGRAEIYSTDLDDSLKGRFVIPVDKINCKARIQAENHITGKAVIEIVHKDDSLKAKSSIIGYSKGITGIASIRYDNHITGKALIYPCSQIQGKARIEVANDKLKATSTIRYFNELLQGKSIIQIKDDSLKAKAKVVYSSQLTGKVEIAPCSEIKCKAIIRQLIIDDSLKAKAKVCEVNDSLKATASILTDIKAKAKIIANDNSLKAKAGIQTINDLLMGKSSILVELDSIKAKADIIEIVVNDDLYGKAAVLNSSDLNGNAEIKAINQIECKARIVVSYDIKGKAEVITRIKNISKFFIG